MTFGYALTAGFAPATSPEEPRNDWPPADLVIDNFTRAGSCGISDTFTRTVDPGWNGSDSGFAYADVSGTNPDPPNSVDGSRGLLSSDAYEYWTGKELPTSFDSTADWTFVIEAQCNHTLDSGTLTDPFGTDLGEYISFSDGGSDPWIELGTAGGTPYIIAVNNTHLAYHAVDYTQPFKVRVAYIAANATVYAKVWQSSGSEPGWQVAAPGSWTLYDLRIAVSKRRLSTNTPGPRLEVRFDNLDVSGLPGCFTQADPYGMGLISSGTYHWANPDATETGIATEGAWYAANGIGYVRLPLPQSVSSSATIITLNDGSGSSISPWGTLAGDGIPATLFADGVIYHIDVLADYVGGDNAYVELHHLARDSTSEGGFSIGLFYQGTSLWMTSYDDTGSSVAFTWAASTWYRVKVWVNGSTAYVRVWARDLEAEPDFWHHSKTITPIGGWTIGQLALMFQSYGAVGAPPYATYMLDNFEREEAA